MGQKEAQSAPFEVKKRTKEFDNLVNFAKRDNEQPGAKKWTKRRHGPGQDSVQLTSNL